MISLCLPVSCVLLFCQEHSSLSSKQLTASADNLLSLRLDTCLTLASSLPLGLSSDTSPVSPSSASAARSRITRRKPVRRKRRVSTSTKRTPVERNDACECESERSCLLSVRVDSEHNSNSQSLCHQLTDARTCQLESDAEAAIVHSTVNCRDGTPPMRHQAMKLPRPGSSITRQKAFYNIERPLSIVRRDSPSSTSDECVDVTS